MDAEYFRFYNDVGRKYPEEKVVYNTLRGRLRKRFVLRYLENWKGDLLDIGCNRGMYLEQYKGGWAVGVDIAFPVLHHARNRCKNVAPSISFVQGDAEELFFIKNNSFDHIVCSELLEHVYKPENVVAAIARILKPNGTVLITAPHYTRKKAEWIEIGILEAYNIEGVQGNTYYHTAFKPEEIARMLRSEGLDIIEFGTLEREVRYATKIPMLFYLFFAMINKLIIRSKRFEQRNALLLDRFSVGLYNAACFFRMDSILKRIFREGVRSYVLARNVE